MSVFTPVDTQELQHFLRYYAAGSLLDYAGIESGVENSNFFVTTTQGEYVLTLFEQHKAPELDYFLHLMTHMQEAGLPTARPLYDREGHLLRDLNGKPAALVTRLPGQTIDHPTPAQCAELGAALARLHLAGTQFAFYRPPDRGHIWRMQTARHILPTLNPDEATLLAAEIAQQASIPFSHLPNGVIHADLFRDNTLFDQGHLSGILDWYYACNDSWLYDLAIVANDWCSEASGRLDAERLFACLMAYHQIRPLQALEQQHWAGILRAAALRFWLSRLLAVLEPRPGNLVLQKDPAEFRDRLQYRQTETALIRACWPVAL